MDAGEFAKKYGVSISRSSYGAPDNPEFKGFDGWTVTLKVGDREMTTHFYKGPAHKGAPPTVEEVLECLALDASTVENARDFEDWCAELGYDTDSRRAERIYKACLEQTRRLRKFLGARKYERLVFGD